MTIDENAQPAGLGPMSEDAAADLIANSFLQDEDENEAADVGADATSEAAEQPEASDVEETDDVDLAELSADDENDTGSYYDIDKLDPDMPIRLRDGSSVRWGDLKRDLAEAREIQRQRQDLQSQASQFQQTQTQIAQQRQYLEQVLPQAIQVLQSSLPKVPPMPNPALAQTDPFAYQTALAEHLGAKEMRAQREAQLQHMVRAQHSAQQEAVMREQQTRAARSQREGEKLVEAMPVLRDPAKRAEFIADVVKYASEAYGATEEEVRQIDDHRTFLIMRDAIAYRKLMAKKPAAQAKARNAPPVQKPGKRHSESEQKASAYKEKMHRLRKTGSMDDAAALILEHHLS